MAHKFGLKVIVQGVETTGQRDWLVGHACDFARGYYFSHPPTHGGFEQLLVRGPAVEA